MSVECVKEEAFVKEEVDDIGDSFEFMDVIFKEEEGEFHVKKSKKILSCDECEFTTRDHGHLGRHRKAIHEGIKHSCEQCEYSAATTNLLKSHIDSVHLGIRYGCDDCEYKT